jgi:hypothetical protein
MQVPCLAALLTVCLGDLGVIGLQNPDLLILLIQNYEKSMSGHVNPISIELVY